MHFINGSITKSLKGSISTVYGTIKQHHSRSEPILSSSNNECINNNNFAI